MAQPLSAGRSATAESWRVMPMDRRNWLFTPIAGASFSGAVEACTKVDHSLTEVLLVGADCTALVTCALSIGKRFTIYDFVCDSLEPLILCKQASSLVIGATPATLDSCSRLVELCAGLGGIGVGAEWCDFQVVANVDKNQLVIDHLSRMGKTNVLQGDLSSDFVIRELHASLTEPAHAFAAGFSCQPFSYQGDQGGFSDARSSSFWATLRVAHLCDAKILMLECTPGAGKDPRLRSALQDFAQVRRLQIHEVFSKLSDQWAARRDRWWAVLYPASWPQMKLRQWGIDSDFTTVQQLIPVWPVWPHHELEQLKLTSEEEELYFQVFPAHDGRVLKLNQSAPVFLHSYGSATTKCPCECRLNGFSSERLHRDGLRGVVLVLHDGFRFLHPQEMALILGYPLDLDFGVDLKATMCLLGQLASPLQSIWLCGHLRQIMELVWNCPKGYGPEQLLGQYKEHLLFQRHHLWALPDSLNTIEITLTTNQGGTMTFTRLGLTHVRELLQAQRFALDYGCSVALFDGGDLVSEQAILQTQGFHGAYRLDFHGPGDAVLLARGCVALVLHCTHADECVLVPAGTMIFEALQELGHFGILCLQDHFGTRWGMDARLWHSVDLFALHSFGAGPEPVSSGLSMRFVSMAVDVLLRLLPQDTEVPFVTGIAFKPGLGVVHFGPDLLQCAGNDLPRYFCLLMNGHWWLVSCCLDVELREFTVRYWDGFQHRTLPSDIESFIRFLENWWLLDCAIVGTKGFVSQQLADSCGTIMLAHLISELFGVDRVDPNVVEQMHTPLCTLAALLGTTKNLVGGAPSTESQVLQQLSNILVDKGVPQERVQERAAMALKKIGIQELQAALQSKNPWLYLKSIGSRPHVSFQWAKGDELQQKIRTKATSKFSIQPSEKKRKGQKPRSDEPLCIDPSQLQLVENSFFKQIAFSAVGPEAVGIAFATAAELAPFLSAGQVISKQPLGVLTTVSIPEGQSGVLQVETLRYPAPCPLQGYQWTASDPRQFGHAWSNCDHSWGCSC